VLIDSCTQGGGIPVTDCFECIDNTPLTIVCCNGTSCIQQQGTNPSCPQGYSHIPSCTTCAECVSTLTCVDELIPGTCCNNCTGYSYAAVSQESFSGNPCNPDPVTGQLLSWLPNNTRSCVAQDNTVGICCYKDSTQIIRKHPDFIQSCACQALGSPEYFWTQKTDCIKSVDAIDCDDQFSGDGACCNGNGVCTKTTQPNCLPKYWQGSGIKCSYNYGSGQQFNVCTTGTGGCCTSTSSSASCVDEVNGLANCNGGSGLFYGCGKNCGDGPCTSSSFNLCDGDGTPSSPWKIRRSNGTYQDIVKGQEFAGGIVVGIFNPNGSQCLGNTAFGGYVNPSVENPTGTSYVLAASNTVFGNNNSAIARQNAFNFYTGSTSGTKVERPAGIYQSVYDLTGYGFTLNDAPNASTFDLNQDKWLLIVSKHPVMFRQYFNITTVSAGNDRHFIRMLNGNVNNIEDNDDRLWINIPEMIDQFNENSNEDGIGEGNQYWEFSNFTPAGSSFGDSGNFVFYNVKNFVWSHGGTSHCGKLGFKNNLTTGFSNSSANYQNNSGSCWDSISFAPTGIGENNTINEFSSLLADQEMLNDGAFGYNPSGTGIAPAIGLSSIFRTCPSYVPCINCENEPENRSRRYIRESFVRTCGKWSLNNGLYNTIALLKSDIAEHYLYSGSGLFPSNLKQFYGATGELLDFTGISKGWTSFFQYEEPLGSYSNSQTSELNKTTIGEGCSVWNRMYYPVDGPTGNYTGKANVVKSAYRALNNQYPSLSHWYIPSMNELAFIAKACKDEALQQKINDAGGVVIGDPRINNQNWDTASSGPTGVNSPNSPSDIQYRRSYVWTSCGTWKDGATLEYLQKGSSNFERNTSNSNNQFTNAWAIKFDPNTLSQNINNYKVSKFHDLDDRLELRLVRMVRCDQRYYDQNSPETLKNSFWQVPRLTISSVVCGAIPTSSLGIGSDILPRTRYNSTTWTFDPQTATIFKNTP
jgi:hypothetical protein